MDPQEVDVAVIGGGPAGYVAAIRAAQLGGKVIVVEKEKLGGVCLNIGCIPTKVLVRSCEVLSTIKRSKEFGIDVDGEIKANLPHLMQRKKRIVARLVGGVGYLFKKNKVQWIKGEGTLIDSSSILIKNEEGEKRIKAKKIIVATGSSPATLPIKGMDEDTVITSTQALDIEDIPENFLIIGGGVIGIEFATIYSSLGSKVTIVELLPRILPGEDAELSGKLRQIMTKRGIDILTSSTLDMVKKQDANYIAIIKTPEGTREIPFNKALVSIGRVPNSRKVGLENAGIKVDKKGWIQVNSKMQTNIPNIYAAGDVVGGYMLAHVAYIEGEVAAENAMGKSPEVNYRAVPRFVCSTPEMAAVGLTEEEAKKREYRIKVGRFPFIANGKALIIGESEGMVKIICDAETEEILGIHILGPQAMDLILEGTIGINLEATLQEIINTIHPHPGLGEAIREAALDAQGRVIHI